MTTQVAAETRTEGRYARNPRLPHMVTMDAPSYSKPTDQNHVR